MKTTVTISVLVLAGSSALALILDARNDTPAASSSLNSDDPVVASFSRELNRKPGLAAPAERSMIDEDELYRLVNSPHWTRIAPNGETGNQKRSDTNEDR